MTIDEYIKKLNDFENTLKNGKLVEFATRSVMSQMVYRIFEEGKNTAGNTFKYSQREAVINTQEAPRTLADEDFQPFSKAQRARSTKKGYRGTRFKDGYAEFKKVMGRSKSIDSNVNWRLNNELLNDFANARIGNTQLEQTRGEKPKNKVKPVKVNDFTYRIVLKKPINIKKREWLEAKYGTIFNATRDEIKAFEEDLRFLVLKALPV